MKEILTSQRLRCLSIDGSHSTLHTGFILIIDTGVDAVVHLFIQVGTSGESGHEADSTKYFMLNSYHNFQSSIFNSQSSINESAVLRPD